MNKTKKIITVDITYPIQTVEVNGKSYRITIKDIAAGFCICGCGEEAVNRSKYFNAACRQRVSRRKRKLTKS